MKPVMPMRLRGPLPWNPPVGGLTRRLEFTNGGWCMHDEAAPHYMAT